MKNIDEKKAFERAFKRQVKAQRYIFEQTPDSSSFKDFKAGWNAYKNYLRARRAKETKEDWA